MKLTSEQVNRYATGQVERICPDGHFRGEIDRISIAAKAPILFIFLKWEAKKASDGEWYVVNSEHIDHDHMYEFNLEDFEDMNIDPVRSVLKAPSKELTVILHAPADDNIDPACVHGVSPE